MSLALAGPGACDRKASPALDPATGAKAPGDDGYLASPTVTGAVVRGEELQLSGRGAPAARVRLASPAGQSFLAVADAKGRWTIAVPAARTPQIFGLSMIVHGRQVQAQGYVLADADGAVTLLRAGAGAVPLVAAGKPRITAFDYDGGGGAVVSGLAPAGAVVTLRGDGGALGDGRADADGRFSIPIARPVSGGQHRIAIAGQDFQAAATVEVSPAAPLAEGPFRSRRTPLGLRADWMTPGGGVQTTLILDGAQGE